MSKFVEYQPRIKKEKLLYEQQFNACQYATAHYVDEKRFERGEPKPYAAHSGIL